MSNGTRIAIPSFVRIKSGALDRMGLSAARHDHRRLALLVSQGMLTEILDRAERSLRDQGAEQVDRIEIEAASFELASERFGLLPRDCQAIIGLGGGRALDVAKYLAFLSALPYYATPTSLSNDGFCSPQSSLTLDGRRRSLRATMPFAVVVDTEVCRAAPEPLWWSGVGDLVAKVTAGFDWKLAYHRKGEPVDDFAALLSDATVMQFLARPERDLEGIRLLASALMLNGVSMEICGSSRPASGAEHLISHALDEQGKPQRLHGLQVGLATYIVSRLQGQGTERIASAFDRTGFWNGIRADPFDRAEWLDAVCRAPEIHPGRYTILSDRPCVDEVARMIDDDPRLLGCFVES
ncbi:iron-containing alcohol dehydrogenase family protein [soil metagenome]